jgi:hypothetical protein
MTFRIQIVVETEAGPHRQEIVEIARLERHDHNLAEVGLTLAEGKQVLADRG